MHSQEHTSLNYSLSRDTKRDNGKNVFLVRASGTLTEYLQVCVVFSLFWSRKQQVQHILCCDEPVWCYWRQERIQIFKARITVEGLGQGRVTWAPCSVMYCVWCLSCTWSLCLTFQLQKRSNSTTLLLSFFFSILLKTLFILSWGSPFWDWYQAVLSTTHSRWCVGFSSPQNSVIPTFIKKVEPKISLLMFGVYLFVIDSLLQGPVNWVTLLNHMD